MAKKEKSGKSGKKEHKSELQTGERAPGSPKGIGPSKRKTQEPTPGLISPRRRQRAGEAPLPTQAAAPIVTPDPLVASARTPATPSSAPTTALITSLAALANRSGLLVDARIRASGLRSAELSVYALLAAGQKLTPGDVVEATGLAATTISSLIRRAESRGDLERTPNPRDARSSFLVLTDTGRFRYTEALVYLDPLVRDLKLAGVPTGTQVVSALGVLRRWVDAMGAADPRG